MNTIHTSMLHRWVQLEGGAKGEIVAVYLDNVTVPRFLVLLQRVPTLPGRSLVEVEWSHVEYVLLMPPAGDPM